MPVRIRIDDHSNTVLSQIDKNTVKALTAMGTEAVGLIVQQMESGYWKPIRETGTLMGDVNYDVRAEDHAVDVGNSKEYAPFVHEGTSRMQARPYITDALTSSDGISSLKEVIEEAISEGFDDQ